MNSHTEGENRKPTTDNRVLLVDTYVKVGARIIGNRVPITRAPFFSCMPKSSSPQTRRKPARHPGRRTAASKPRRHKNKRMQLSWAERSFGHIYKRVFWVGGILAVAIYAFVFYKYFVSPYTGRWRALYGEIEYPAGYSIHGLDVSHHQGEIDWEKVARTKVAGEPLEFVIIKATEGKSLFDRHFNENFYQAGQYGLIRGAYHFFSPSVSGDIQARYYMRQVHLEEGDLPPILDIEVCGNLTTAQLQREALEWLDALEKRYGVPPLIYTGLKFKEKYLNAPKFDRYPFWIAHYYVKQVGYKGEWKFWQHTDIGRVDGIKGPVDLNIYNGSMYDLRKLTIGHNEEPVLPH